jgi:hypothetical protein
VKLEGKQSEANDAEKREDQESIGPCRAGGPVPRGLDIHERVVIEPASSKWAPNHSN